MSLCRNCRHLESDHVTDGGPCGWCNSEWVTGKRSTKGRCLHFEKEDDTMEKRYCVVGKDANYQFERRWYIFEEGATDHAKELIRTNTGELYVVKVVAIVKKAAPPIEVIHLP